MPAGRAPQDPNRPENPNGSHRPQRISTDATGSQKVPTIRNGSQRDLRGNQRIATEPKRLRRIPEDPKERTPQDPKGSQNPRDRRNSHRTPKGPEGRIPKVHNGSQKQDPKDPNGTQRVPMDPRGPQRGIPAHPRGSSDHGSQMAPENRNGPEQTGSQQTRQDHFLRRSLS